MTDLKPPRLVSGERETLCALLQYQRESLVRKVLGVSEHDAGRRLVASDTTLLWLMQHIAWAETLWIVERFAGTGTAAALDAADTLDAAVDRYRATWQRVDSIVTDSELDETCRNIGDDPLVNLRWVLMHLLEETSRHAGHADILRELIDGSTGR